MPKIILTSYFLSILLASLTATKANAADWQYSVRPGDTIWSVCAKYTFYANCWKELGAYNGINEPRSLSVGERLKVPAKWLKQSPVVAKVVFVNGQVSVGLPDKQQPLASDQSLSVGTRLVTGQGTATLQFLDGSLLMMSEHSELIIDAASAFKQTRSPSIKVRLPAGEVRVSVPPYRKSRFEVQTPTAVAAVRGTLFRVNAVQNSKGVPYTRSEVLEGVVQLDNSVSDVALNAGFGSKALPGQPVDEPVELLHAPEWNLSCTDPGYAEWQANPAAQSYRLVLMENDTAFDKVIATRSTDNSHYTFTGLQNKCYQLRVNAVDNGGYNGREAQREFCYELALDTPVIETVNWRNSQLTVNWNDVRYAESYSLEISRDAEFSDIILVEQIHHTSLDRRLPQMPEPVFLRLRAQHGQLLSNYSEVVSVAHKREQYWLIGLLSALLAFAAL